jgi:DMSO reductase family type II enzyme heme b subunit
MKDEVQQRRKALSGRVLYAFRCEVCHGEQGMGDGPAADFMYPRPRDFSLALFKYKSSPGTLLPRDADLFETIKFGLPGTAMPGWAELLSDEQIDSLLPVIKRFDITAAWAPEEADEDAFDEDGYYTGEALRSVDESEPVDGQIAYSEASVAKGREAFIKSCKECHGETGRGNIESGKKLEDDWGFRIWPRDLTKPWNWRASQSRERSEQARDLTIKRIYQRLSIGIPGTPMPAHRAVEEGNKDPVSLEDRWHIANFVYSVRNTTQTPTESGVITAARVEGALPAGAEDERWAQALPTTLHLVPNIIKEERLFTPLNDAITVRTLYNEREIAFLLELDDRTESRPGIDYFTDLMDENLEMMPDAFAIQFPKLGAFSTLPSVEKPLYRHGDAKRRTTIWYWNAGSVEPERAPAAMLLEGAGPDRKLEPRADSSSLKVNAGWKDGKWSLVMTRPRQGGAEGDLSFDDGQFIPVSFANWDGSNGEVGSRHTLTTWYWLVLPPDVDPVRVYGLPLALSLLLFLAGYWWVGNYRKRRSQAGS